MKTLLVVIKKEFRQFFGNAFLPKLCLVFPLMVMLIMPLVTNMEVKNVGVAMVNHDHSSFSRRLAEDISASDYLHLQSVESDYAAALRLVEKGQADVIVEIPRGFYAALSTTTPLHLNLSANAVNATKGTLGLQYVQNVIASVLTKEMQRRAVTQQNVQAKGADEITEVAVLNLFNPTLDYRFFMIPALMIMLLVMLCGFLSALSIVSEKEHGTIEQINVSPISQLTFTLGKVIPYWIIALIVLTLAMLIARLVYGLSPVGGLLTIYAASMLFVIIMSSLGIAIANGSGTMQQVMFVMFFFVMVFILMSGLMTPIQSMPQWAQTLTYAIPPRYYIDIMRSVYLRGATMADLWRQILTLGAFAMAFTIAAISSYRKQS